MTLVALLLSCLGVLIVAGFAVVLKTQGDHRKEAEMTAALLLSDVAELKAAVAELKALNGGLQTTASGLQATVAGMRVDVRAHLTKLDEIKVDLEGPVSIVHPPSSP